MSRVEFERYYPSWLMYIGTGRRFLPQAGGLDDQFEAQMRVFRELDSLLDIVVKQNSNDGDEDGS